jgi:hypothetical protein
LRENDLPQIIPENVPTFPHLGPTLVILLYSDPHLGFLDLERLYLVSPEYEIVHGFAFVIA